MSKWPDEVPVLSGTNICRDSYGRGAKRCLAGWYMHALCNDSFHQFTRVAAEEANAMGLQDVCASAVSSVNDSRRNRLSQIARLWNRVVARLGYVVNNPECTKSGKLKPVK